MKRITFVSAALVAVAHPTGYNLTINLKAAEGLTIPPVLLLRADNVVK